MTIKQSRYITVDTTGRKDDALRTTEVNKVKDDQFVRKSEVQQSLTNSTLPVSARAVKIALDKYATIKLVDEKLEDYVTIENLNETLVPYAKTKEVEQKITEYSEAVDAKFEATDADIKRVDEQADKAQERADEAYTLAGKKADKEYVDEALDKLDLSDYATIKYVDDAIADIEIGDIDLSDYATIEYVDDAVKSIDLSEYRKLDNNEFSGILQINCEDDGLGTGIFFLNKDEETFRANIVTNSAGLQFNQQFDGKLTSVLVPSDGSQGTIATREWVEENASSGSSATAFSSRLVKEDLFSPCFKKISAGKVAIKAGSAVVLKSGEVVSYDEDTEVSLIGDHVMGSDYAIYADKEGLHAIVDNFEDPAKIPDDAVLIGGYHYSLVPENETLSTGQFATSGAGMIWTQADVDKIRGINEFSLWDIRFRAGGIIASPLSPRFGQLSNHAMAFDRATNRWYGMFHVSSDVDKFGVSRAGTDIASDTVKPIIPSAFNGNGVKKYGNLNWWTANELVQSQGARLLFEHEFNSRAFGTTENKVAGGSSSTYPKTERIKGLTSKIGCEQVTGVQFYWGIGDGASYTTGYEDSEGRGQPYQEPHKPRFGGSRSSSASDVGSRFVVWVRNPWYSDWTIGAVATRDLLIL